MLPILDETSFVCREFFCDEVRKIDANNGKWVGPVAMRRPDNLTWNADGKLLVASHTDPFMELTACRECAERRVWFRV